MILSSAAVNCCWSISTLSSSSFLNLFSDVTRFSYCSSLAALTSLVQADWIKFAVCYVCMISFQLSWVDLFMWKKHWKSSVIVSTIGIGMLFHSSGLVAASIWSMDGKGWFGPLKFLTVADGLLYWVFLSDPVESWRLGETLIPESGLFLCVPLPLPSRLADESWTFFLP